MCAAQTAATNDAVESLVLNKTLRIPRLARPPKLEDFVTMKPAPEFANGGMLMVNELKQRLPNDGAPVSQKTEIYLGYDQKNLYAAVIAFDNEPQKIRAHMSKREDIFHDDEFFL